MPDRLCVAQVDTETGFLGGEAQVFLMMEGLRDLGHRMVLFCPPGSRSAQEAAARGFDSVAVRMRNDLDVPAVVRLARGFRDCGADLVHLHTGRANWLGGIAARLARLPAVSTRRMDRRVKRNWRTRLLYEHLVRRVVSISPAVSNCLAQGGVAAQRLSVIHDAVDPQRLQPHVGRESTRAALGAGPDDLVLLSLAALIPRKGLDLVLEAVALLGREGRRPRLWVAGDGPLRHALEAQARRFDLGGQVEFLGERRDAPDLLAGCDVFVLASRREGMGVAALEAMAASRPVVCSAVGGLATAVVEGRTGLLFPPGDVGALAGALGRILRDGELRERLGRAGPSRIAEGFLAGQLVEAYDRVYRDVIEEWSGSP
jgi:glycosyltransferase involved in cell wall biosynthesis